MQEKWLLHTNCYDSAFLQYTQKPNANMSFHTLCLSTVMSRLDYRNSPLYGCPKYLISRLQKVQNNAVRLILKVPKTDHITPHLQTLHWLPVNARIQYKICSLCFNAVNSSGPQYLADLLKIYSPSRQLRSSADTCILHVTSVHTKI